MEALKF